MAETSLEFQSHDHIRALFGPQDRFLKRIRDATGVDIVVHGEEIRISGSDEEVKRALEIVTVLHAYVEQRGRLPESEVDRVLGVKPATPSESASSDTVINVFEKAKQIRPRTPGQAEYTRTVEENDLTFCIGPAGCGKTYLAVALAINALRTESVRKIVLVRPAVEAGEKLGFLPGDLLAKVNPYLRPLLDALHDILDFEQVKRYMEHDVVEIVPLAFMRGRTLNETFIILDEGQNTTVTQMKMFLTRMGEGSKIVVTGDITQLDLPSNVKSGMTDAVHRLGGINGVGVVRLGGRDIVRHRLVRDIVNAYDEGKHDSRQSASFSKSKTQNP
ncbi:PhoH family protein [Thalassoroseus pseudoceratinae]|uniref:PhoH family protein n=1 Tax=Thalassoroseus pseudoceratinae TaxID=2713176 RepID=UPI00141F5968|nr:PhoH family protein [Thalassoroseus pseudoceratinae]